MDHSGRNRSLQSVFSVSTFLILRPRESFAESAVVSDFRDIEHTADREKLRSIWKIFFSCLSLSMGAANIWRFPLQLFNYGNATYIYIYIFYCLVFGAALVFFEISVGQCAHRGFSKMFACCPIFEGVAYSMAFHSTIINLLYNAVNVYSVCYMVWSFKYGANQNNLEAKPNFGNMTDKPCEQAEFTVKYSLIHLLVWILIVLYVVMGILRQFWIGPILTVSIICTLVYTLIVCSTLKGSLQGVYYMFVPIKNDLSELKSWLYPLEQFMATYGLGAGPLLIYGTQAQFKAYTSVSTLGIVFISLICSLLIGTITFMAVGVMAHGANSSAIDLLQGEYKNEVIPVHMFVADMVGKLSFGLSQFTHVLFFMILFLSGLYTATIYTYTLIVLVRSRLAVPKGKRLVWSMALCFLFFLLQLVVCSTVNHDFHAALDQVFLGPSLLIIITCETFTFCYAYGMKDLCDDIEFTTGHVTNLCYQFTWISLPVTFLGFTILSLTKHFKDINGIYDWIAFGLLIAFIVVPILGYALYNCYVCVKTNGDWTQICTGRDPAMRMSTEMTHFTRDDSPRFILQNTIGMSHV